MRHWKRNLFAALLVAAVIFEIGLGLSTSGCGVAPVSGTLKPSAFRSQKLTALAAEEAGAIPDPDVRLTRQLNLAELQINRGWKEDARSTLAAAGKTLESKDAEKLNDHARISGWVAVSELSRSADDKGRAVKAAEQGVEAMRKIEDPAKRCQYVMGLANELQYLKGKEDAVKLLAEAGPWTKAIDHLAQRRQAVTAFAAALFNLDDYAGGQSVLRQDDEAAWRAQTLLAMASTPVYEEPKYARDQRPGGRSPMASHARSELEAARPATSPMPSLDQPFFGRQLNYRDVFQNQLKSQTAKD